jgi:4-methylaminobutanoate oxidase (formaldehyde-forming)
VGRETILRDGQPVGYLTSGGFGYTIQKSIGYGYVRHDQGVTRDWLAQGRYALVIAGEETPATLTLDPPHDPTGSRIRA